MARPWTLTLHGDTCGAAITYTDERPAWEVEVPDPALVTLAAAGMAEHPRCPGSRLRPCAGRPRYVGCDAIWARHTVQVPAPRHYVVCPACDGRAYRESGLLGVEPAAEREGADA